MSERQEDGTETTLNLNKEQEMINEEFLQKFDEDDRLISYHPTKPIKIFGFELDCSECDISIPHKLNWTEIAPILTKYLDWLSLCENEATDYFRTKSGEDLSKNWFRSIEVYNASITFITLEDFGATIKFGESIFSDHIIEFNIDKFEITDDRLNG